MNQIVSNDWGNKSLVKGEASPGTSKFTPLQMDDRLTVHAKALTFKTPTVDQICQLWKEKYAIDVSNSGERLWRKTNYKLILKKKQQLIDSGEIQVSTIGPKALSENMMDLTLDTSKTLQKLRLKVESVLNKIKPEVLDDAAEDAKNNNNVKLFVALTGAMTKLSDSLTKQITTLADLAGVSRANDSMEDADDEDESAKTQNKDFDPSTVIVSDEDRAVLE